MIVMVFIKKLKSAFLLLLSLIKRCFCCFKRYAADTVLPITNETLQKGTSKSGYDEWDDWDKLSSVVSDGKGFKSNLPKRTPMEQHIMEYRQSQQEKLNQLPEPEDDSNLFQELAPKIAKKPQVIIYTHPEEEQQLSNRLSFTAADPCFQGSELQDWEENDGWEEEADNDYDVNDTIREHREKLRQEKKAERLKKKAQREEQKRHNAKMAVKMS